MRSFKFFFCVLGLLVFAPVVGAVALLNIAMRDPKKAPDPELDPVGDDPGIDVDVSSPA